MNLAQFHSHITGLWNKQNRQGGRHLDHLTSHLALSWTKPSGHETCWLESQAGSSKRHWEGDGQEKELEQRKAHGALRRHQSRLGWCLFCEVMFGEVNNKGKPQERDRAEKQSRLQACCSKQSRGSSCLESHLSLKRSWGENFSPLWKWLKLF